MKNARRIFFAVDGPIPTKQGYRFSTPHLLTSYISPCERQHCQNVLASPGNPATVSQTTSGLRPVALRPILSDSLPFSGYAFPRGTSKTIDQQCILEQVICQDGGINDRKIICNDFNVLKICFSIMPSGRISLICELVRYLFKIQHR